MFLSRLFQKLDGLKIVIILRCDLLTNIDVTVMGWFIDIKFDDCLLLVLMLLFFGRGGRSPPHIELRLYLLNLLL